MVDRTCAKVLFDLQNRRPKDGPRSHGIGSQEGTIVVVFSFENRGEQGVVVSSNLPSSMDEEALIVLLTVCRSLIPKPPFSLG